MELNPVIFLYLLFSIIFLAIAIAILIVFFIRLVKKFHLYRQEVDNQIDSIAQKNSSSLDEARNKAIKIIDEANNKALDIIQHASIYANVTNEDLNKELKVVTERDVNAFEKATADFLKVYQTILEDLKSRNVEIFQNTSSNIETITTEEFKKFKEGIEQETILSQKIVKDKIDHAYSEVKKDIDSYRQNQLKAVNENIFQILETVSKLVLGRAIELSHHEELIIESLEKAKKENIFDSIK